MTVLIALNGVTFFLLLSLVQWLVGIGFEFQHDISANILQDTEYSELMQALQQYQRWHNADTILHDPDFCSRHYVVATYACPQAIGNHMHEFLNNYIGAYVTNRTLLWSFCNRKPCQVDFESDCSEQLNRFSWILSYEQFKARWQQKNCNGSTDIVTIITPGERHRGEEIAMCCGLDEIVKRRVVNYGTFEMHEFMGLKAPNARLSVESKRRAQILFEFGEDFGFGIMFRTTFSFKKHIVESNDRLLTAANLSALQLSNKDANQHLHASHHHHPLTIGVHLRHSATVEDKQHTLDESGISCVHEILAKANHTKHGKGRPCVILLASDRNQSLTYWQGKTELGCGLVFTDHSKSHIEWTEHGPYTGSIAMHDFELVSRADLFIGSPYFVAKMRNLVSTFSLLIAERRASSGSKYALKMKSKWLTDCVDVLGAKFAPKKIYTEHNFTCVREEIAQECPYYDPNF